jgi:hypothetical protein
LQENFHDIFVGPLLCEKFVNNASISSNLSYTDYGVCFAAMGDNIVKILRIALLIPVLVVTLFVVQPPRAAHALSAECGFIPFIGGTYSAGGTNGIVGPFASGDHVTITVTFGTATAATFSIVGSGLGTPVLAGPSNAPGKLSYTVTGALPPGSLGIGFFIHSANGTVNVTATCGDAPTVQFFDPGDDRLNREPGQPAALYCRNQGVHVYAVNVDDSRGKLVLTVTKAEIDAVINRNPTANTLIKQSSDGKFKLYYLPTGKELSFITTEARTGKQYSFVWQGLCR